MARDEDHSLSPVYREALRLQAAGHDDDAIAAALDVAVEAVPALLLLGMRKLARAESDPEA